MGLRVRITAHNDDVDPTPARSLAQVNVVRADVRELRPGGYDLASIHFVAEGENMPTYRIDTDTDPTLPDHGDSGMVLLTTLVDAGGPAS